MPLVPGDLRAGTAVQIRGVMHLVVAFNHGFAAPIAAQQRLLAFMRGVDADEAQALEHHYVVCSGFRMPTSQLGSPPTHLDFFKDERVRKSWRQWSGLPMVLLHANELLRTWPDLMQPSWEAVHAARDCAAIWEARQIDITELHRNVDAEGERNSGTISELEKQKMKCYGIIEDGVLKLNYLAYVVFMQRLPGVLARRMHLQASFFDAFADIGSSQARAFLAAKFQRVASDPAAAHLRGEVDPPTLVTIESGLNAQQKRPRTDVNVETPSGLSERHDRPAKIARIPAAIGDNVIIFAHMVKQSESGIAGAPLKRLISKAYANFLKIVSDEEQKTVEAICAELKDSTYGLKAVLPEKWKHLALAAIAAAKTPESISLPAGDIDRISVAACPPGGSVAPVRTNVPFSACGVHGAAKDAANAMLMRLLRRGSRIFFLDSWEDVEGLKLRTTSALLQAGHLPELLFSANPDVAICKQLRQLGVQVHEGPWADSFATQKFNGIYLDLCSGSESYMREQLLLATTRSEAGCILGWTLTERDFNGTPLLIRAVSLIEFLGDLGWTPAMQRITASMLVHRSSKSNQQVLTQFWVKQE